MRCPECGRLMLVAFIDDARGHTVFQCSTAGVPLFVKNKQGNLRQISSTTDHSDRYFVQARPSGPLVRCEPVDLGTATRPVLAPDRGKERYHRWTYQVKQAV